MRIKKHITLNLEICISHDISYPEWILCSQVEFLSVRKGYCYAKKKTLAEALKMSVRGIQKMTDRLIEKGLIEKGENMALMVTEKWLEFQEIKEISHEQSSPQVRTKCTHSHEQSSPPTIKRDNLSVEKKKSVTTEIVIISSASVIAKHLLQKILENKPNFIVSNINSWIADIDKAIRLDKRTENQLIGCIDWIYSDAGSFWIPNILSGRKLRDKFDTIEAQMMNDPKTKKLNYDAQVLREAGYVS